MALHDDFGIGIDWVQRGLDELREEFYVLTINFDHVRENRRTGEQISPGYGPCICPNCSEKVEAILYSEVDDSPQFFCDGCFDESWRSHVEEKLAAERAD